VRRKSSISMSGPTWWFEMNASTLRPVRRSTALMNLILHGVLELVAGVLAALNLDHRLLDVRIDASERSRACGGDSARET